MNPANKKGFTLIELLVVIVIIATLAVVVFVALDPVRRFAEARNSRRWTDVNSVLTAVHEYVVDNKGALPTSLTADGKTYQIGTCAVGGNTLCTAAEAACANVATDLTAYLKSTPIDPQNGTLATTGYSVAVATNNMVTVAACGAEQLETVEVSR
ncbi:hypothetical protein A2982_04235 [candidate division WWE3 bacterium RIFCSPLOWO2_01_FULL_39_13]|uniref:Type II secretion system protein GspG C-terminal domain-containing protein n=1 Tax=candidate division WWE3 bacterium RIFCSPLOWO2_01_FULL_39_13 TaxID=1802624 RepID=A0A1F4V2J5_UNCKA|nr:MAG: hypothetical protein A2982_04235 [candidate division WWE3 bacterium RIFCSPLOWO2_01_FULL_39_13]